MANFIATVSIPCAVVQQKNTVFVEDGQILPQIKNVPCREVDVDDVNYWATPVKDFGIFTSLKFTPQTDEFGNAVPVPSFDSFSVFRVRDKLKSNDWWYIVGDIDNFYASCQTCCGDDFQPMPCTPNYDASPGGDGCPPLVVPCQQICDSTNPDGDFISIFAAPALGAGQHYQGDAAYNNEELDEITAANINDLITQMNTHWGTVGSPAATFVWTHTGLTITGTGGFDGDEICVLIQAVDD